MRALILITSLLLVGCATSEKPKQNETTAPQPIAAIAAPAEEPSKTAEFSSKTAKNLGNAATTPLNDLNLVRDDIPPILLKAKAAPYQIPADKSCAILANEIQELDVVLGPDLDAPGPTEKSNIERGVDMIGDAAISTVKGAAAGLIPFRGWVRKLSGADKYSKEVTASINAGTVRRAFLKGLRDAQNCNAAEPAKS